VTEKPPVASSATALSQDTLGELADEVCRPGYDRFAAAYRNALEQLHTVGARATLEAWRAEAAAGQS